MSVTISDCRQVVGMFYRIRKETMEGPKRKRKVARPRQMAMTLAREIVGASYPRIGQQFGGRDHTTVLHAKRRIADLETWHPQVQTDMENFRLVLLTYKFQQQAVHP